MSHPSKAALIVLRMLVSDTISYKKENMKENQEYLYHIHE